MIWGREDPNTTIKSVGHYQPASETPFNWRFPREQMMASVLEYWLGSIVIFQEVRTGIAKTPIFLLISRGGSPDPLSHPLDRPRKL